MKLTKCILLATVAVGASIASANTNCKDAANSPLNTNRAKSAQLAANLTGQAGTPAASSSGESTSNASASR